MEISSYAHEFHITREIKYSTRLQGSGRVDSNVTHSKRFQGKTLAKWLMCE